MYLDYIIPIFLRNGHAQTLSEDIMKVIRPIYNEAVMLYFLAVPTEIQRKNRVKFYKVSGDKERQQKWLRAQQFYSAAFQLVCTLHASC